MKYNFDEIINRENTNCLKYDLRKKYFGDENVFPLWVADMDFASPGFIQEAIIERARHPIYGYTFPPDEFYNSITSWMQRRHGWTIKNEWISYTPGVVPALNLAIQAFTIPGDKVIVQPPVYFPFFSSVKDNKRELVYNQLIIKNGNYEMDFDDLERKIDGRTKLILLCHPHNPAGRVWKTEDLLRLVRICEKNGIIIVSDEIHSDLMLHGNRHVPLAAVSDSASKISITCIAPSKTFNLAGLSSSALIIPEGKLKRAFDREIDRLHLRMGNIFGITAMQAAYEKGDEWLGQLLAYLDGNIDLIAGFFHERIPEVKVFIPEATYMVWLDFSGLGLSDADLRKFIISEAGLGLNDGPSFGPGGTGFQRLNFALPREKLVHALEILEKAVRTLS